jgi:hypothetical protein
MDGRAGGRAGGQIKERCCIYYRVGLDNILIIATWTDNAHLFLKVKECLHDGLGSYIIKSIIPKTFFLTNKRRKNAPNNTNISIGVTRANSS